MNKNVWMSNRGYTPDTLLARAAAMFSSSSDVCTESCWDKIHSCRVHGYHRSLLPSSDRCWTSVSDCIKYLNIRIWRNVQFCGSCADFVWALHLSDVFMCRTIYHTGRVLFWFISIFTIFLKGVAVNIFYIFTKYKVIKVLFCLYSSIDLHMGDRNVSLPADILRQNCPYQYFFKFFR